MNSITSALQDDSETDGHDEISDDDKFESAD